MNKLQSIFGIVLASTLISCSEQKLVTEIVNEKLRVNSAWIRSDGQRIIEYTDNEGVAHMINEGFKNRVKVVYSNREDKFLIFEKREIKKSKFLCSEDSLIIDHYVLHLPNNYTIQGITTEEGLFINREKIDIYNLTKPKISSLGEQDILKIFRPLNPIFSYPPEGNGKKCNISFKVKEIYLMGLFKHRPRETWETFENSGNDEIAGLAAIKDLTDTDISILCIDKYGNNYNIGSELFTWKEDKYNIITLKRAGTDTTLTLDTRITSDDIKVDCYSLIIPKSVTIDNLKYVQILTLKENKEPRALYNLLVKNGCFTYDKRF